MLFQKIKIKDEFILDVVSKIKTNCIPLPPNSPIVRNRIYNGIHVAVWNSGDVPWDKLHIYDEPSKIFVIKESGDTLNLINKFSQKKCEILEIYDKFLIFRPNRKFKIPEYRFDNHEAKVLLHDEGGYGDFFSGLRYLGFYPKIKWVCDARPSLFNFSKECGLFFDSVLKGDESDCQYHLSIDSLVKKHSSNSFAHPFIKINPLKIESGFAFCYKGNRVKRTKRREFDKNLIKHLSESSLMYNLQYDEPPIKWAKNLPIKDWLDTARIISACSAVICPSTAIAHLAGGLGKKTYVVISKECEAYETVYFKNKKTPFYPNSIKINETELIDIRR